MRRLILGGESEAWDVQGRLHVKLVNGVCAQIVAVDSAGNERLIATLRPADVAAMAALVAAETRSLTGK